MYQKMKMPKINGKKRPSRREEWESLRKELAIERDLERKQKARRAAKALRNQPKLNGDQLNRYRMACEDYAQKVAAFHGGKMVKTSGKGKDKKTTVTIAPNHPAMPAWKPIYKSYLKAQWFI